ncbi:MAG: hypothetical protein L0Y42_13220 [Phycisphaerales bacterium]|nr:hypothetical protein [Phycisphaerales bacterium]
MSEFRFEPRHRFRAKRVIGKGLTPAPGMLSGALIPDFQAAVMGNGSGTWAIWVAVRQRLGSRRWTCLGVSSAKKGGA